MLLKWKVPKTIQWLIKLFVIYLCIFTLFRITTVIFFKPKAISFFSLLSSFWLGLQYDLRWIAILLLPISFLSLFPRLSPFFSEGRKKFWTIYLGVITLLVLLFFGADFAQFSYVNARLNADALIFVDDPKESLQMIWESYPIVWIGVGLIGAVVMMIFIFRKTHVDIEEKNINIHKFSYRKRWHLASITLLIWFIYGFLTFQPLDFDRAFRLNNEFRSNLALNPFQNFFTTLGFREPDFNTKAQEYYSVIYNYLNLSQYDSVKNSYTRIELPNSKAIESHPNVVLVICESFSMYKSSMSGNPLNTTPYFNELCNQGIFFDRCFSPTFGTARGIFAIISGTPDVQLSTFSTRIDTSVKQRTIINEFKEYDKFYFIGGRSEFNNFKGLISNIKGVNIYEEGKYKAEKINAWGISDKNLFLEANEVLSKRQNPFFAIIQTADNHRPFNIPKEDTDFQRREIAKDSLKKYGFDSQDEFDAFCYTDYCFKKFIEAAKQQPYFDNTIFVFIGDHGVVGNASEMYPAVWTDQRLSDEHIPLLMYAPKLLSPQKITTIASQIDVLPTIASLLHQPYANSTLGRNLLDEKPYEHGAFIIYHAARWIGMITDDYFFRKNFKMNTEELYPMKNNLLVLTPSQQDSVKNHLSKLTSAMYETSKYMLVNNK